MLLLKKNSFELHSPTRLVKAEEAAAVRRAQEMLADAEAEAARIRGSAQEAYDAEKQRGYEQGLEEGKAAIVAKKLELLDESVAFMESVEGKMVEVVMTALKKCVMEIGDEEMVVQIVRKVMNAVVRNQRRITLKVAPEMVSVVRGRLNEILADYPPVPRGRVCPHPSAQMPHGCGRALGEALARSALAAAITSATLMLERHWLQARWAAARFE